MNFALSAILIVILLLPGATLIKVYYTSIRAKESSIHIPLTDLLLRGLAFSFFIHACAIGFLIFFNYNPRFNLLYNIITGKDILVDNNLLNRSFLHFSLYNGILIIIAVVFARLFKLIIRRYNLDINYYTLRNVNYWYLLFSARYLEINNEQGKEINADLIYLDILCDTDVIYSGLLHDFNYSPHKDELENIVLTSVRKRSFKKDETESPITVSTKKEDEPTRINSTGTPFSIPGDYFMIQSKSIRNINLIYLGLEGLNGEVTSEEPSE